MESKTILFAMLRSVICAEVLTTEVVNACTPKKLEEVLQLARKHDLAHFVYHAIEKTELPQCEALLKLKKIKIMAIHRYAHLDYELECICRTLEHAQIPFIPLKGSVLRQYYPEPWMRTSGDIDVLVREADLNRAAECLVSELGYKNKGRAYHDVVFQTPGGVLLELHFILTEESSLPKARRLVDAVWEFTEPVQGKSFERHLTNEMFFFHHILHMACHFSVGGCGIRFLLDHFIINKKLQRDPKILQEMLLESGLTCFAEAADELSEVWFGGAAHTARTEKMEKFILSGGTFGSTKNQVAISQAKEGSKFHSVFSKIVLPYDHLKGLYPILRKKKWLTPVFQIIRWFRLLNPQRWKRSVNFLKSSVKAKSDSSESVGELMQELGL